MMFITIIAPAYGNQAMTNKKPIKPDTSKNQPFTNSPVRTVEGIIQNVSIDSIQVRGQYYSIAGIKLINSSGENLNKSSLSAGEKVEIFFQEGKITSILIYDDMLE
jgi:hypothetical protein